MPPTRGASTAAATPGRAPTLPSEDPDPATADTPTPAILARALGYPYPRPDSSFVFHAGTAHEFEDAAWPAAGALTSADCVRRLNLACDRAAAATAAAVAAGLTPVLAIGSNAGPAQLARKYAGPAFAGTAVVSTRALLHGFDVCYAPLVSSYGSVTATLTPCADGGGGGGSGSGSAAATTAVEVYVSWLDPAALERMHETEAAYDLVALDLSAGGRGGDGGRSGRGGSGRGSGPALALGTSAAAAAAGRPPAAWHAGDRPILCYVHQHGSLLLPPASLAAAGGGRGSSGTPPRPTPVALAEVAALGRSFPALTQAQAQAAVAHLVSGGRGQKPAPSSTEAFILENVRGDPAVRAARVAALAGHAAPFAHPAATRLATLGSVFGRSVD